MLLPPGQHNWQEKSGNFAKLFEKKKSPSNEEKKHNRMAGSIVI